MKKSLTLTLMLAALASPALATEPRAVDPHPATTVEPGTVSMSAGASHDLIETLGLYLNPSEMQSVHDFLKYALISGMGNRKVIMQKPLAERLNAVRTQMVADKRPEAVRSLDTTLGPWMRAALAAKAN
jgi:hypothetical protein